MAQGRRSFGRFTKGAVQFNSCRHTVVLMGQSDDSQPFDIVEELGTHQALLRFDE